MHSDDCPSKWYRRLTTSYSAVVARTHRVMCSRLIFVSGSDIDFLPQLARTGSYERSNCGRLAKDWRLQSQKVKQTFNCSQARTIAPPPPDVSWPQESYKYHPKSIEILSACVRIRKPTMSKTYQNPESHPARRDGATVYPKPRTVLQLCQSLIKS